MNTKIKTEVAIGVILLVAILVGGVLWLSGKQNVQTSIIQPVVMPNQAQQKKIEEHSVQSYPDSNTGCANGVYNMDVANGGWGISFDCPQSVNVQSDNGDLVIQSADDQGHSISISYNSSGDFYNPPINAEIKDWVVNRMGYKYENYGANNINNKIGSIFVIDNMPTLHLVNRSSQAGVTDKVFVINKNRLFEIVIFSGNGQDTINIGNIRNANLNDSSEWYTKILKSLRFN
jgi:hypothetical protein